MNFQEIGVGLAQAPNGVRVAVTGRYEVRVFSEGEIYSIGMDSEETTRTLLSGEVNRVTDAGQLLPVSPERKAELLSYAQDGLSVLSDKTILIAW